MAWEDSAALSKHTQNILTFPPHEWARIVLGSYFIRFLSGVTETEQTSAAEDCSNGQTGTRGDPVTQGCEQFSSENESPCHLV
jgi:hypothetical protein